VWQLRFGPLKNSSHPLDAEFWQHRYKNYVRAYEFAERQIVSLIDIDGIGRSTLYALYEIGMDTADKILATPTAEILEKLASHEVPRGKAERRQQIVDGWKVQIRELQLHRKSDPSKGE
jgi:hypothetical protein